MVSIVGRALPVLCKGMEKELGSVWATGLAECNPSGLRLLRVLVSRTSVMIVQ